MSALAIMRSMRIVGVLLGVCDACLNPIEDTVIRESANCLADAVLAQGGAVEDVFVLPMEDHPASPIA
jgi:hypothetical protein